MVGTRDCDARGWDYWSVVRNMQSSKVDVSSLTGAEKLDIVVQYLQISTMNSFQGSTLKEVQDYLKENDDKYVKWNKATGISVDEVADYLGGYEYMLAFIERETADTIEYPSPIVNLILKYAGSENRNITVVAYQVNSAYPEYGEQPSARWDINPTFDAGVAKVELAEASAGSLKQGPARFVAFIDTNVDGKLSTGETSGSTTVEVGYLGCDLVIALGESNPGLPALRLSDGTNAVSTIALVRSEINGKIIAVIRRNGI